MRMSNPRLPVHRPEKDHATNQIPRQHPTEIAQPRWTDEQQASIKAIRDVLKPGTIQGKLFNHIVQNQGSTEFDGPLTAKGMSRAGLQFQERDLTALAERVAYWSLKLPAGTCPLSLLITTRIHRIEFGRKDHFQAEPLIDLLKVE